jgi:hypothetical protein
MQKKIMRDIFGISFSNIGIHIVYVSQTDENSKLLFVDTLPYPFTFSYDAFFSKENLNKISTLILKQKADKRINDLELFLSLPINFAFIKRIAVPLDVDGTVLHSQIEWGLRKYLPKDLSEYKIIKTDTEYLYNNYKELVVISIDKSIISKLNEFAVNCGASLKQLVLDNFSIENYLNANNVLDKSTNQLVFRIEKYNIDTHVFINGKYYLSFLDNLNAPSENYTIEEKILELAIERYKQSENLLEQLPFVKQKKLQLFVYGSCLNKKTLKLLTNNFTTKIEELTINKYPDIISNGSSAYIEALGVVLNNTNVQ